MIAELLLGTIALALFKKRQQSVSGIGRTWFGGNSGYDGYSMSVRAREARNDGKFPKTDFKKYYHIPEKTFAVLVDFDIIDNREWHHTSKYGNRTVFYSWDLDEYRDIYAENKTQIDEMIKQYLNILQPLLDREKYFRDLASKFTLTDEERDVLDSDERQNNIHTIFSLKNEFKEKICSFFD